MAYLLIEDFKAGMDRRRSISTAPPGSLWNLVNAHITRGGEIEKRKAFVPTYELPAGTFGLHSVASNLYVFGSIAEPAMPAGITYQRLQHVDGTTAMSALLDADNFDGKIYAIAEFTDGNIYHYYDGIRVKEWDGIAANIASNNGVASALAIKINSHTAYNAAAVDSVVTVTAAVPGTPYTLSTSTANYGSTDDQTLTAVETQANAVKAPATGSLDITGGTVAAGNEVSTVTVDGVDILGVAVAFDTDNATTAAAVASQINAYTSAPNYTASASSATVTIEAADAGSAPNGYVVSGTVGGDVTIGNFVDMNGGVDDTAQVTEVTVGGTFEPADVFTVTLDGLDFAVSGAAGGTGRIIRTYNSKMYSLVRSLLHFCAVNAPTQWATGVGAGYINLSNHNAGSEVLTGVEVYQDSLAVFARRIVQIWHVQADETQSAIVQTLKNTGTRSHRSVLSFGDSDVFYLSDTGVRSLRARDSSNAAYVNDVGTALDTYVRAHAATLTTEQIEGAVGVIEPVDGRYWLAMGGKVFVFSYFPASKISAWSVYEPGFQIDDFVTVEDRVYSRASDTVYLYGGADGETYDSAAVTVQMPYLDAGKPATFKQISGVDMAAEGAWDVDLLVDPSDESRYVRVGEMTGFSYFGPHTAAIGHVTHVAPKLTCTQPGAAKISNFVVHYQTAEKES